MSCRPVSIAGLIFAFVAGSAAAQQVAPMPKRALSPIETVQQAAKEAAEFEFLGTLARTCFLPPSRSEDFRDIPAPYVSDPSKAPPRASWYAEPAKVFDNLYFVGGSVNPGGGMPMVTLSGQLVRDKILADIAAT